MDAETVTTPVSELRRLVLNIVCTGRPDSRTAVRPISLLLVLVLPAVLLYPTRDFHLLEPDEGRYAQIPKEMLITGQWIVPTLQGEPYLDKPPLMYWLTATSYWLLGISAANARLIPAVAVHLTILSIYWLGRRSVGEKAAFWAALLLTIAPGYIAVARLLLLDGLLTLCITLSLLCGYEAVRTGIFRPLWWLAAAMASAFGFLTKGPIAEILLLIPLWTITFLTQQQGSRHRDIAIAAVRWYWYVIFFIIVAIVNLPWYVAIYLQQPRFLSYFFWQHNILRFLQPFDHLQPVWYYVPILLVGLMPATPLFLVHLVRLVSLPENHSGRPSINEFFWLLTAFWCLLFFSCSGSKLPTYILPAYPPLCLALGAACVRYGWNRSLVTHGSITVMFTLLLCTFYYLMPLYARERSPYGRPELIDPYVANKNQTVVCFSRNCDSIAFYLDRMDLKSVRTRDVNSLYVACHFRPATVILFTHQDALAGFRSNLPPSLAITRTVSLRRNYGTYLLNRILGNTPWGLCDIAVVQPVTTVQSHGNSK
ncbi:MAG: glycosyltransferase family 39 protein [Gemmataceae bacterium]|nr:glycosyltransferase family 39 protein [Gemmataceae bacterium]